MDSDTWIRLIMLFLLILGASYCAASEISFAAANRIRIEHYANRGDPRAKRAIYILDHFDRTMTTLLVGNNITHIGFASLATALSTHLWGVESVKYTAVAVTVVVFLISELIPKSFAKANSESFALSVSGSLMVLMKLMAPVTGFFTALAGILLSRMPVEDQGSTLAEEEFDDIVKYVQNEEILDEEKKRLFSSAIDFDTITVGDILTPLEAVEAIDIDADKETILSVIRSQNYSRFPVYDGDLDRIKGILQATSFLKKHLTHPEFDWTRILMEPYYVKRDRPADELLKEMNSRKIHMAIVKDERGKTIGLITLEDILEELVGEIWDESDTVEDEEGSDVR